MKQVTGSNLRRSANKVSIQQSLDGHSFSVHGLDTVAGNDAPVEVEVLSARTMLVPAEAFDAACDEALLAANGTPATQEEQAVYSDPDAEIVAVMAVSREALAQVGAALGARAGFTTPLLATPEVAGPVVWMHYTGQLLYIKVYDKALRLAEVIPAPADADIIYFTERLGQEFPTGEYTLLLAGDEARRLRKLLGKRFGQVLCE